MVFDLSQVLLVFEAHLYELALLARQMVYQVKVFLLHNFTAFDLIFKLFGKVKHNFPKEKW